jgi:hypothetical protein
LIEESMMKLTLLAFSALLALPGRALAGPTEAAASLKITNSHLIATCFDGKPVAGGQRRWDVAAPVSLTLTMRNEPRPGIENVAPGLAVINFTPEAGHKYEIEVQAVASANSMRVWPSGKWTPTVRDRTIDRVVSSAPTWIESGCGSR